MLAWQHTLVGLLDLGYKCRIRLPLFISAGFVLCHIFSVYLPTVEINVEVIEENRAGLEEDTEEEENEVFDAKKVSPLKLSLRGIEVRASSSSCSNDTKDGLRGQDDKVQELVTNPDSEHRLQDDNAMFPSKDPVTPVKRGAVLDISSEEEDEIGIMHRQDQVLGSDPGSQDPKSL